MLKQTKWTLITLYSNQIDLEINAVSIIAYCSTSTIYRILT